MKNRKSECVIDGRQIKRPLLIKNPFQRCWKQMKQWKQTKKQKKPFDRSEVFTYCIGIKLFYFIIILDDKPRSNKINKIICIGKTTLNKFIRRTCNLTNCG